MLILAGELIPEELDEKDTMMLVPRVAREEEPVEVDTMAVVCNVEDNTTAEPNIGLFEVLMNVDMVVGNVGKDS